MGKIKDPLRVAGNSPIQPGVERFDAYGDSAAHPESPKISSIGSTIKDSNVAKEFISVTKEESVIESKSMVEQLKDKLPESELVDILVRHARNTSATIAKPYIFFLCEKYGLGVESGGFGGFVESGFAGIGKTDDWEEGE